MMRHKEYADETTHIIFTTITSVKL